MRRGGRLLGNDSRVMNLPMAQIGSSDNPQGWIQILKSRQEDSSNRLRP